MSIQIFILIFLICCSAFFSGLEIAFFSLSHIKVRNLVDKKVKNAALVKKLKDNPQRLIITILIGNNIVNISAASLATVLVINIFGSKWVGFATGIVTLLVLIFGEITPKVFATSRNKQICLLMAKPVLLIMYLFLPLSYILEVFTKLLTKYSGQKQSPLVSEEELKTMAKIGVEEKVIEKYEGEMISRVFELNNITAGDIMTPELEIASFDADLSLTEILPKISSLPFSRIPIFHKTKSNIVGILYAKDILKEGSKCIINPDQYYESNIKLIDICRKPLFVPAQMLIRDLLKTFQAKHLQIALVVDEHGSLWGLVTLEDILEELVGEIIDETDVAKELIKRLDKKNILVKAQTEIGHINHFFNTEIQAPRNKSISAYLLPKFGKIPTVGDEIETDNLVCFITEADDKKIKKVRITKK